MTAPELIEIIKLIYPVVLLIIGFGAVWTLLTKRMKKDINSKVDQKQFDDLKDRVKGHDEDISKLEDLNRDTNTKVTDIWKYMALGKRIIPDKDGD